MDALFDVTFANCRVQVFSKWIKTEWFAEGRTEDLVPPIHDKAFMLRARQAGYGDPFQYAYELQLLTGFVAEHAKDGNRAEVAECMQRFINMGMGDNALERAFGDDINRMHLAALMMLRPWLFRGFAGRIPFDPQVP